MKRLLCLATLTLAASAAAFAEAKHVILISIDGFAARHLDNANLELPNIRALAQRGVLPDGSETVFPSVTHPSHTTLITGMQPKKHGVLANELPDPDRDSTGMIPGNSLPRAEAILSKTIFDTAKAKGLKTAAFFWPETVGDKSIDFNLITRASRDSRGRALMRNSFTEELVKAGVPIDVYDTWRREGGLGLVGDAITAMAVSYTIKTHKPNLIAIHFVNTDHEQHAYGPEHYLAQASLTKADYNVGQVVRAVEEAGLTESTAIFISADHGFTSVYDEINIRPMFAEAGLESKVRFFEGGWAPFIRLTSAFNAATDQPKLDAVLNRLRNNPRILRLYKSDEFPTAIGLPRYEDSNRVRGQYLIVADSETYLVWTPDDSTELRKRRRPAHGHGFLPYHKKMYPVLVMSGSGLKQGVKIGHVHNTDVAPTISSLLGLETLDFDGRSLKEALVD